MSAVRLKTELRLLPWRPLTDTTYGKGAPDAALAERAFEVLAEGVPAESDRPVRPVTIRPDGFYESVGYTGNLQPLSEVEFRKGLGRLLSVAKDGGWHVYGYAYNWERARGEPVAHFGYLTREVVARRPDAIRWQDGRPAMLAYELLGEPVRGSLGELVRMEAR
jgi:hypothetical protein